MKKKTRTLYILCAVLVLIAGAYIGVSRYTASEAEKSAGQSKAAALYATGRGAPAQISYTGRENGNTLSFVLDGDQWTVTGDKAFPLNQTIMKSIVSALNDLTAVRTIDTPSPLQVYGLDTPQYTITASDSGGNAMTLLIGAQNGGNYYAMLAGGTAVYTISSMLPVSLKMDLLSMIALDRIPTLSEATIDTITLTSGKATLTLDKHRNKDGTFTWFIVNGTNYTAADEFTLSVPSDKPPASLIGGAVKGLGSASFSSCAAFKPSAGELKTFGFNGSQLAVTIDYSTTTGAGTLKQSTTPGTVVLEIGAPLGDGSGYYARLQGSDEINVLSADAAKPLFDALAAMGTVG